MSRRWPAAPTTTVRRAAARRARPRAPPSPGRGRPARGRRDGGDSSVEVADGEIPEETAGPYPGDGSNGPDVLTRVGMVRSTSPPASGTHPALPRACRPRSGCGSTTCHGDDLTAYAGAAVYLWHCNPDGELLDVLRGRRRENYLRGVQEADDAGAIEFTTIFPAATTGAGRTSTSRSTRPRQATDVGQQRLRTSQLALPEEICQDVYDHADGYDASVANLAQLTLDTDLVFSDGYSLQLARSTGSVADGYMATPQRARLSGHYARGVPSALPDGEPAPDDGRLPEPALRRLGSAARDLRARAVLPGALRLLRLQHLHRRGARRAASSRATYAAQAVAEIRLARAVLGDASTAGRRRSSSAAARRRCCRRTTSAGARRGPRRVRARARRRGDHGGQPGQRRPPRPGARCARAAINRVSFGMQSAVPPVLAVLDRTHDPERVPRVVAWARAAGLRPGQPRPDLRHAGGVAADWRDLGRVGPRLRPDHVSAYSLIVEEGTALARQVRSGVLPMPDEDDLADKYVVGRRGCSRRPGSAGTRSPTGRAARTRALPRTTSAYWTGADWWGVGPGAHSHVGGVRWWNVKHPSGVRRPDRGRCQPGARARGARRRDPARGAGAARGPARRGPRWRRARRRGAARRCRTWSRAGWSSVRRPADRVVLTRGPAARRPWCATCCREPTVGRRGRAAAGVPALSAAVRAAAARRAAADAVRLNPAAPYGVDPVTGRLLGQDEAGRRPLR